MNLQELAQQYHETAICLERRLNVLKRSQGVIRGRQALLLEKRIAELCEELLQLRLVRAELLNYYKCKPAKGLLVHRPGCGDIH